MKIHTGTIWQFTCPGGHRKPVIHERRRRVVSADLANDLEAHIETLTVYIRDAAGDESVLLPVSTLNAIADRAVRAERALRFALVGRVA